MRALTAVVDESRFEPDVSTPRVPRKRDARWGLLVLVALIVPALVLELRSAQTRPYWYDEICTAALASLGTPSAIWDSLAKGVDTQPPLFFFVTALGRKLVANDHVAFRLPAMVGFFAVPFCLYAFVSRRLGVLSGLVAAVVPLVSGAQDYASEARPYGFEIGCFAVALLCWQRLERSRWYSVPLAGFLAAALGVHYYAILVLPGFALAELVRLYRTRRFRLSAWVPMIVSVAPVIVALPLMRVMKGLYADHFWSHDTLLSLAVAYSSLTGLGSVLTAGAIAVLLGLLSVRIFGRSVTPLHASLIESAHDTVPLEESVIAAFLLCLPVVVFVALKFTQGGLMMRYVLTTVLGLSIASAFAAAWVGRRATAALLVVLLVSYGCTSALRGRLLFHVRSASPAENSIAPAVEQMLRDVPSPHDVVVSSGPDYFQLVRYASPETQARMRTLVDPEAALQAIQTDSVDIEEPLLRPYLPINVQRFSDFRQPARRFLLLSSATMFDWWPARLVRDGHQLILRKQEGDWRLFEVQLR
jgi:Dolichyl-phosphate-mannose-protein mannosyltransferase